MSFRSWASREATKAWGVCYVLTYLQWRAEAQRTGQTYEAIADAHAEQWVNTLADALLSLGPRIASAVVVAVVGGYMLWRGRVLFGAVESVVYRYGVVRVAVAGAMLAFGLMGYVEIASELPAWLQPEAVVGTGVEEL